MKPEDYDALLFQYAGDARFIRLRDTAVVMALPSFPTHEAVQAARRAALVTYALIYQDNMELTALKLENVQLKAKLMEKPLAP